MTSLAFTRSGTGPPLVLLHGLGSSRQAWDPVVPALARDFDVIAVDLPGFGDSQPLPMQTEPRPAALAAAIVRLLDELGIIAPHLAGNSLGGWVALEVAAIRPVASLTLLSPAGLWHGNAPLYNRATLRASRWFARHLGALLSCLVNNRLGRALILGQTQGRPFTAPVTVAFGSRDRLLLRHQSRHLDQLPPGAHVQALPGCGHVPMADDADAVTAVITKSARHAIITGSDLPLSPLTHAGRD